MVGVDGTVMGVDQVSKHDHSSEAQGGSVINPDAVHTEELNITNDGDGSEINSDQIDGYDVEKDGTDGEGVINFKTE